MRERVGVVVIWVAVTVATGSITLVAVGGAGGGLGVRPEVPVSAVGGETGVAANPGADPPSAAQTTVPTGADPPSAAQTTVPAGAGATTATVVTSATNSTVESSTATSTTIVGFSTSLGGESRVTLGGTVIVTRVVSGIALSSAFPVQGWDMAVDEVGPDVVTVVFEEREGPRRVVVSASLVDGVIEWRLTG
jgi:hypothetical protein